MRIRQSTLVLTAAVALFATVIGARAQSSGEQAVALARQYFRDNAGALGLTDPDRELAVRSVRNSGDRFVIRLDQRFRGVKVFEGEAIARVRNGRVDVTNALRANLNIDTRPGILGPTAVLITLRALGIRNPSNTSSNLEILPQGARSPRDVLTWHTHVEFANDNDGVGSWDYFIDAKSGAIVWFFDSLHTQSVTTVTGKTMYSGDVLLTGTLTGSTYSLVNPNQGGSPGNANNNMQNRYDLVSQPFTSAVASFGNNNINNSDPNTAGADGAYGVESTWAFYQTTFGRNGIDNNGTKTKQKIHFGNNYENAFWSSSCFCMTYGDGASFFYSLVALDIAGHEMTHGVIDSEAGLIYAGESGGLNESTADIFGTMVEFYANNAVDTPEYWIGERVRRSNYSNGNYTQTSALRYMDDPHKDGQSPACWSPTIGGLNVHYSSGPSNHMFYLLANGGTSKCNGNVVTGIGNAKASQIWYRALTDFMTSSTNYHQARTAALNAASALYGFGSTEYNTTVAAFAAINVGSQAAVVFAGF